MTTQPKTYTVPEASEVLGISINTLYGVIRRDTLDPRIRVIRAGNTIRLNRSDVDMLVGDAA